MDIQFASDSNPNYVRKLEKMINTSLASSIFAGIFDYFFFARKWTHAGKNDYQKFDRTDPINVLEGGLALHIQNQWMIVAEQGDQILGCVSGA